MDNIPAISAQKKSKLADGLGRISTYCLEYLYTFWSKNAVEVIDRTHDYLARLGF